MLFLASFLLGKLSLTVAADSDGVAIIWLPAGLAITALALVDLRLWPGVAGASLLVNMGHGTPAGALIGIALGSTLGAVASVIVLRSFGFHKDKSIFARALKLGTIGAVVSALISATFGTAALFLTKMVVTTELLPSWTRWWLGDAIAIFLFSSFMLIFFKDVDEVEAVD